MCWKGCGPRENISELCRREGIASSIYYGWSKEFLEAGKGRLAGDTAACATSGEVKDLRRETTALKEVVADLTPAQRCEGSQVTSKRLSRMKCAIGARRLETLIASPSKAVEIVAGPRPSRCAGNNFAAGCYHSSNLAVR